MKTKLILALILFSFCFAAAQDKKKKSEFTELKKHPSISQMAAPVYPETAKKLGITGMVVLELSINEKGDVTKTSVATANFEFTKEMQLDDAARNKINTEFEKAAIDAAMKMKFNPGIDKNGSAVKCSVMQPFKFKLGDKK